MSSGNEPNPDEPASQFIMREGHKEYRTSDPSLRAHALAWIDADGESHGSISFAAGYEENGTFHSTSYEYPRIEYFNTIMGALTSSGVRIEYVDLRVDMTADGEFFPSS